jgi:hypothetical protein
MPADPTPTTVGELAILVVSLQTSMNEQFQRINSHLEKLDGLPLKVQALEFEVEAIKRDALDRKYIWFTALGWAVAIGAAVAGVIFR